MLIPTTIILIVLLGQIEKIIGIRTAIAVLALTIIFMVVIKPSATCSTRALQRFSKINFLLVCLLGPLLTLLSSWVTPARMMKLTMVLSQHFQTRQQPDPMAFQV